MSDKEDRNETASRKSRKIGEKNRRDRLNTLLAQLAEENPWSAASEKRVDKAGILKLTVCFLKFHHGLKKLKISESKVSSHLTPSSVHTCLQEAMNGFLIVVSEKENVVFVSSAITKMLGLHQVDVVGTEISKFIHPEDVELFSQQLVVTTTKEQSETTHSSKPSNSTCEGLKRNGSRDKKRSFYIRMLNAIERNTGNTEHQYEMIHFKGHLKVNKKKAYMGGMDSRWLIAVGRPVRNEMINEIPTMYAKDNEFVTQFDLLGNICFNDHRCALLLCKLPNETVGTSCYNDIFEEDLPVVAHAHSQIMKVAVTCTVFRLHVHKTQCHYVMSRSIVARNNWTKEPKYIVSLSIVLSEEEGKILIEEQRQSLKDLLALSCDNKEEESVEVLEFNNQTVDVVSKAAGDNNHSPDDQRVSNVFTDHNEVNGEDSNADSESLNDQSFNQATPVKSKEEVKSSKRSFSSDGDCDDRGDLQGIEVTGYYLDVNRKKSVLRHLLHSQDNLCGKNEPLSFLSSMDIPKSRYGRHSFQNSDEEYNMPNAKFEYNSNSYKQTMHNVRDTRNVFGNSAIDNSHNITGSSFHPYQRNYMPGKTFQPTAKDIASSSTQSNIPQCHTQIIDSNIDRQSALPLPHLLFGGNPIPSTTGLSAFNSSNMAYSSDMHPFSKYPTNVSPQNYQLEPCPNYNRPINHMIPTTNTPSCITENQHGSGLYKNFGNYPYYGPDLLVPEQCEPLPGYGLYDRSSGSTSLNDSQSVPTNNSDDSFGSFSCDSNIFGNKNIQMGEYLREDTTGSYEINHGKTQQSDGMKYTSLEVVQSDNYHSSSDNLSDIIGKDNSCLANRSNTDYNVHLSKIKLRRVQSPTVDSVTSPSGPRKLNDREFQIQLNLSQQLHSKQNLIGSSLTTQREELEILKTQLQGRGTVNAQYIALLQRLNNLEKEVKEQDNILTDLREQSSVKINQLMSQES